MKKHRLLFVLLALLAIAIPAAAQDVGPGEGAPIIWPNFGGDPTNINPLLISDGPSQDVAAFLWPNFLKINPETGAVEPGTRDQIVSDWTISDDGTVYTFSLRDDYFWSDGTPVTSADVKYAFDAIASGELDSPLGSFITNIASLEAPDPQTVVITFNEADCTALSAARVIPPVPAHVFTELFGTDFAAMNSSDFNLNPTVAGAEFTFGNFRPGEQVTLLANQQYPDSTIGYVAPQGWVQRQLASQTVVVEEFLAGNLTVIDSVPEDREAELRALADAGEVQWFEGPASGWQFLAFNLADPTNPQPAQDENGEFIDQGNHPIFGDVRVRKAFAHAIDHDALNQGAFSGSGIPVASPLLSYSWAYNENLSPYAFDPELAGQLLDEAGFVDHDNDPSTPRVATEDALYAEAGTPLRFTLTTFSGNTSVDSSAVLMQDQLRRVGFDVQLEIIEFQSMLEKLDGQTFDTIMLFFGGFDASNPDELRALFTEEGDIPGSGFNAGSYYNEEVTALFNQARSLPGCDQAERKVLYDRIQELIMDDMPMYFVNTSIVPVVVQGDVENIDYMPGPGGLTHNITAWTSQLEP
jgi:peptide/nickel transport system substrate-binding protein